ncbi:Amidohydrolase [Halobacillus dabanensis]|uniref:Amidohydrolase n=1 Tax=Halobacillus dabanensis TaxID=240302 RepID=A0A1I3RX50_HALDA|nr:amidohydrolase family protein [Halobacillus dabanensis]SFJ50975.1 Amidohydrolase [Halobacillus dabanensis]
MNSITQYIENIRIIDGHEHLIPHSERKKMDADFFDLLHYVRSDLITAGLDPSFFEDGHSMSDRERAELFLKYWHKTKNTTYAQMLRWSVEDLYGMKDWSVEGILELNKKVKKATYDPDHYRYVLKDKAGIDLAFTLIFSTNVDFELFRPVMFMDHTFNITSLANIEALEKQWGNRIYEFEDLLKAMDAIIERYVKEGMVSIKIGAAYWRSLRVDKPTANEASYAFNRVKTFHLKESLAPEEAKPLQDYLIHHLIQQAIKFHMPIQIHTGHQEPSVSMNGNILTNSKVTDLVPLLLEYKEANFVLLHGGYPYYDEFLSIVKNFPNVYGDLTWCYIISPTATRDMLFKMIEMVPQSKIIGFGGDYSQVEGTYAHAKLARRILSEVLISKIEHGDMTEEDACEFADYILRDNLIDLYNLNMKYSSQLREGNHVSISK